MALRKSLPRAVLVVLSTAMLGSGAAQNNHVEPPSASSGAAMLQVSTDGHGGAAAKETMNGLEDEIKPVLEADLAMLDKDMQDMKTSMKDDVLKLARELDKKPQPKESNVTKAVELPSSVQSDEEEKEELVKNLQPKEPDETKAVEMSSGQSEEEEAKAQAKFVQDWKTYISCYTDCTGQDAKACAKDCYTQLAKTADDTTKAGKQKRAISQFTGCCTRYTATCLSCTAHKQLADFCEDSANVDVPGCTQVLAAALYEERLRNQEEDAKEKAPAVDRSTARVNSTAQGNAKGTQGNSTAEESSSSSSSWWWR